MTEFSQFVLQAEPVLRRGLVARFGAHTGREAAVDVLSWAWPRWDRVVSMENPTGYLYRVAVNQTRRKLVHPFQIFSRYRHQRVSGAKGPGTAP